MESGLKFKPGGRPHCSTHRQTQHVLVASICIAPVFSTKILLNTTNLVYILSHAGRATMTMIYIYVPLAQRDFVLLDREEAAAARSLYHHLERMHVLRIFYSRRSISYTCDTWCSRWCSVAVARPLLGLSLGTSDISQEGPYDFLCYLLRCT